MAVDQERRRYIVEHFRDIGLSSYRFFDAIPSDDVAVHEAYRNGLVAPFPPCFRCGKGKCTCANNVLIPPQVANWLSFRAVWNSLPPDPDKYYLICEDDVAFHTNALEVLAEFITGFTPNRDQVLIRLASSGEKPFRSLAGSRPSTHGTPMMSNVAYLLNGKLAARLLREPPQISTTSDVWLHRNMATRTDIQAITLDPLLATDLSYNKDFARFISQIHPKGINSEDKKRQERHVMSVDTSETYHQYFRKWSGS